MLLFFFIAILIANIPVTISANEKSSYQMRDQSSQSSTTTNFNPKSESKFVQKDTMNSADHDQAYVPNDDLKNSQNNYNLPDTLSSHKQSQISDIQNDSPPSLSQQQKQQQPQSEPENNPNVQGIKLDAKNPDQPKQQPESAKKFSKMPWNITDIITEGYDARLRPNFGMGKLFSHYSQDLNCLLIF
ncbi:uncharacterized protein LOC142354998 [Convolutriloba macropyga]|uniref:uncharacterized protein LOC142354998 n=1 Tax=Convolutriloba macropyga TaxID=536237 RepID=UPI003F5248C0